MSTFDDPRFQWRETYFVLFDASARPSLRDVEAAVQKLGHDLVITEGQANSAGKIESLTVRSAEDHAALDISYLTGEDVFQQGVQLAADLEKGDGVSKDELLRLTLCDARFDVMHFAQVEGADDASGEDEDLLDPSSLLVVLDALIELTGGLGVDPQSGTLMN